MTPSEKEAFVTIWAKLNRPKTRQVLTVENFTMKRYRDFQLETEHIQYKNSETVIVRTLNNGKLEEAMYRFDKVGKGKIKVI